MRKHLLNPWMAIVTLIVILAIRIYDPSFVESVRLRYFDQLITSQEPVEIPVSTVNIDEASLKKYGQWPFPRNVHAEIVEDLYRRNAGLVVLNVLMPEKDRLGGDSRLVQTLQKYPVVMPELASTESKNTSKKTAAQSVGNDPWGRLVEYPGIIANIEPIERSAAGLGVVNTFPEIDGVVRRMPLLILSNEQVHPSLALETIRVAHNDAKFLVKFGETGVDAIKIPSFDRLSVDGIGRVWIDWRHKPKQYSLVDLPEDFGGEIVIVGVSAQGLINPVPTSAGEVWPQDVQATLIGTLLNKSNIIRNDKSDMYEILALAAAGIILLLLTRQVYVGIVVMVLLGVGGVVGSYCLYRDWSILVDATAFTVGITLVALHAYTTKFLSEFLQKQKVKQQFGSYVNPVIVERLQENPDFIKLGGEKKELTIIMSDMRNFTGLGETYGEDVEGFVTIMNRYMTAIAEPILRNNGCLIKFIGDASLHVHGAPIQEEQDPDHCIAAVRTALEMLNAVEKFNVELQMEGKPVVGMGLGINTGLTLIGNIGAKTRFAYDVLGDSVSTTARLESQTKNYGVNIILSEATRSRVEHQFFTIELDTIAVKGKSIGTTIYTVFYNPDQSVAANWNTARERHNQMLELYRGQQWTKAKDLCVELKGSFGGKMDEYYQLWQERIHEMSERNLPQDWDGIYRATSK